MTEIRVESVADDLFDVEVSDGRGTSRHRVTASHDERARYAGPGADGATLVEASFRFLLEREPKESILPRFSLSDIEGYFPEYPREIRRRLDRDL